MHKRIYFVISILLVSSIFFYIARAAYYHLAVTSSQIVILTPAVGSTLVIGQTATFEAQVLDTVNVGSIKFYIWNEDVPAQSANIYATYVTTSNAWQAYLPVSASFAPGNNYRVLAMVTTTTGESVPSLPTSLKVAITADINTNTTVSNTNSTTNTNQSGTFYDIQLSEVAYSSTSNNYKYFRVIANNVVDYVDLAVTSTVTSDTRSYSMVRKDIYTWEYILDTSILPNGNYGVVAKAWAESQYHNSQTILISVNNTQIDPNTITNTNTTVGTNTNTNIIDTNVTNNASTTATTTTNINTAQPYIFIKQPASAVQVSDIVELRAVARGLKEISFDIYFPTKNISMSRVAILSSTADNWVASFDSHVLINGTYQLKARGAAGSQIYETPWQSLYVFNTIPKTATTSETIVQLPPIIQPYAQPTTASSTSIIPPKIQPTTIIPPVSSIIPKTATTTVIVPQPLKTTQPTIITSTSTISPETGEQKEIVAVNILAPNNGEEIKGEVIFIVVTSQSVEEVFLSDMREKFSFAIGKGRMLDETKKKWEIRGDSRVVTDGDYYYKARALQNGLFYDSPIVVLRVRNGVTSNQQTVFETKKIYNPEIYGAQSTVKPIIAPLQTESGFMPQVKRLFTSEKINLPSTPYIETPKVYTLEIKKELRELSGQTFLTRLEEGATTQPVSTTTKNILPASLQNFMPFAPLVSAQITVLPTPVSASIPEPKIPEENAAPVVIIFDDDNDGLPNDLESFYGTDSKNPDTDNDSYLDGEEVKNGFNPLGPGKLGKEQNKLSPIEKAIFEQKPIEQPILAGAAKPDIFQVHSIENVIVSTKTVTTPETGIAQPVEKQNKALKFSGKAVANSVVTLYIYSSIPIVVAVKTDANGNWTYVLDKDLKDGQHEVYVAINNENGQVQEKSNPLNFFVKTAQAVDEAEFVNANVNVPAGSQSFSKYIWWSLGAVALALIVAVTIWVNRKPEELN